MEVSLEHDFESEYLLNDGQCPKPMSGPRVIVAYWAVADIPDGERPEINREPYFTITYPVGWGARPYNWKHNAGGCLDDINPNSANNITWDGNMTLYQRTEYSCRQNFHNLKEPEKKTMNWALSRDMPNWLWARIYEVCEISEVTFREDAPLHFTAPDSHYIRITESGEVVCDKIIPDDSCRFLTRFPGYKWDNHGGSGDEGDFFLLASNRCYLRFSEEDKKLYADATSQSEATLFTTIRAPGSTVALATSPDCGYFLRHDPPYGDLYMANKGDNTWSWFNVRYACADFSLIYD